LLEEYPYHVEAHGVEIRLVFGQVLFGQGAYGGLLAGGNGVEGIPVALPAPQLDLHKDDGVPLTEDEIQLPEAGAVVALDELVAVLPEVAQREVFAPRASGTSAQGPTPA